MLLLCLLSPVATAHPAALRVAAHEVHVALSPGGVDVLYAVEVPLHTPTDLRALQSLDELASGLVVDLDGATVPLVQAYATEGRVGHTQAARLTLRGERDGAREVRVSVGNYPDMPGYFTWSIGVDRALHVVDASLDHEGRRLVGDAHRRISVTIAPDDAPAARLWRALTPDAPSHRPLAQARPPALGSLLHTRAVAPPLFLGVLGGCLALGLGVAAGRPSANPLPPAATWGVAALPALAAVGLALPVAPALFVEVGLAVAGLGLVMSGRASVRAAAVAAVGAALALTLGATGPTLLALAVLAAPFAVGLGRGLAPHALVTIPTLCAGALAASRAIGGLLVVLDQTHP